MQLGVEAPQRIADRLPCGFVQAPVVLAQEVTARQFLVAGKQRRSRKHLRRRHRQAHRRTHQA